MTRGVVRPWSWRWDDGGIVYFEGFDGFLKVGDVAGYD